MSAADPETAENLYRAILREVREVREAQERWFGWMRTVDSKLEHMRSEIGVVATALNRIADRQDVVELEVTGRAKRQTNGASEP